MNHKKLIVLVLTLCVFALAGCGSSENPTSSVKPNTFTYGVTTEPDHLNPFQATSADSRVVLFNLFEGLLKPSPSGEIIPAVAEKYEVSEDFTLYVFTLRDVYFHHGEKVTAEDVKYSIEQAIEYKWTGMNAISSVEIIDEKTIQISLKEPDSEFYYSMTTAIVPKDYDNQNSSPIGTGPFKFESYTPQQELVLVKHEKYWNAELPKVDGLIFKIKSGVNTILLELKSGSLDAGRIDSMSASQLDAEKFNIFYENANAVQMLCLNNAVEPFNDVRVRRAISYVVSADEIIGLVHDGHAQRAGSPVIPALASGYNSSLDTAYAKNITHAKELLAEAGYPDGFSMTITVPSSYQQHINTAQLIVNQLAEINIRAKIVQVDWPTWLSETYTNRQYETTVISVDGVTLSPRSYLFRYESSNRFNFINYSNTEYDALFQKSLTTNDEAERIAIYHRLQTMLSDDAASVFICDISSPKVFRRGINGSTPYPLYIFDGSTIYFE